MVRYLLSRSGKQELDDLIGQDALYAFDFDGTLARIVRHYRHAGLDSQSRKWLKALGKRAPTSIISGRSLNDLKRRVNGTVHYLIGNHGLEGAHTSPRLMRQAENLCTGWRQQLLQRFRDEFERLSIGIEDKVFSLSLHYREARQREQAARAIHHAMASLKPLPKVIRGKCVVNLLPKRAPHKGEALQALMKKANRPVALYIGDDDTDEYVFSLEDPRILTVRIGRKGPSAAKFFLRRQSEIADVLRYIVKGEG
jgi:trehalose 6-phosphate phosphatase